MKAYEMAESLHRLLDSDPEQFNEELRRMGWITEERKSWEMQKALDQQLLNLLSQEEKLEISEELKAVLATFHKSPFCANHIADRINSARCLLAEILALANGCDSISERRFQEVMDVLWLMRLEVIEKDD
jgi:hypothetical protein